MILGFGYGIGVRFVEWGGGLWISLYHKIGTCLEVLPIFAYMNEGRNKEIINWLRTHRFFSIHQMCSLIKVDTSNFKKYVALGKIPDRHLDKVERVIKDYGYQIKK